MAGFSRLEVLNAMMDLGLVPVFYHPDLAVAKRIVAACRAGGARVVEFTNRGDFAFQVFAGLAQHVAEKEPGIILGVGTVVDAPTASLYLSAGANFVVGLVDLYGIPSNRVDLSRHSSIKQKVSAARGYIHNLVPSRFRTRFHQHFAVHEVEAWLLAYPERWPAEVRGQIKKRPPEQVNFDEPPAKFLKKILGGKYKKTVYGKNLFPVVDPQSAIDKCPFLRLLAEDLLAIAKCLR